MFVNQKNNIDFQTEGSTEHINLKVTGQDGSVVHFKIKKNTPLRKLMQAYCDRAVSSCPEIYFFQFVGYYRFVWIEAQSRYDKCFFKCIADRFVWIRNQYGSIISIWHF